jgi:ribonuclease-3 family protein
MPHYNGVTLAYIGDAIYEQKVRLYLLEKGFEKVDHLHKEATHYTSAVGQTKAYHLIKDVLTDDEMRWFKRGRNATSRKPAHLDLSDYQTATGFEALLGYLYLSNNESRIDELLQIVFNESAE